MRVKRVRAKIDRGILYMLFASLLFAFMGAFAKLLSQHMGSIEVVFFRNVFGVLLIASTLYKRPLKQAGGKPWLLFFRGFMGFTALLAFFYNIAHIPLADAMTFSKTSPIFTALFAYLFLKESFGFWGWVALFIGFVGIVLITGGGMHFDKYDLLGIFSGVGAALAYTSVRELKRYYDTRAIVLSFMLVGTLGPLLFMSVTPWVSSKDLDIFFAPFVIPHGVEWGYIVGMGLFATLAQVYMTKAYGVTKAGIIGTISYANIPFSIVVGLFLGDDFPSVMVLTGIVLIVISGVMVASAKQK